MGIGSFGEAGHFSQVVVICICQVLLVQEKSFGWARQLRLKHGWCDCVTIDGVDPHECFVDGTVWQGESSHSAMGGGIVDLRGGLNNPTERTNNDGHQIFAFIATICGGATNDGDAEQVVGALCSRPCSDCCQVWFQHLLTWLLGPFWKPRPHSSIHMAGSLVKRCYHCQGYFADIVTVEVDVVEAISASFVANAEYAASGSLVASWDATCVTFWGVASASATSLHAHAHVGALSQCRTQCTF